MIRHYVSRFQNQGKLWYSADQFCYTLYTVSYFVLLSFISFFWVRNFFFFTQIPWGCKLLHSKSPQFEQQNVSTKFMFKCFMFNSVQSSCPAPPHTHQYQQAVFRQQCLHSSSGCNAVTAGGCAAVSVDRIIFKQHTCYCQ